MTIHRGIYRGSLMTFQHYLNAYHSFLPYENRDGGEEQLYNIKEWYRNGILKKIEISLDENWAKKRAEIVRKQKVS